MTKFSITPNTVLSLIAPTASGKTALAYELYDTGKYELISVDSALIYRDMNIGTAKPSEEELLEYPHHLVNIIEPTETYNVASFVNDVDRLITEIHARGKIPLLVGGTMMYYMALFDGISNVPNTENVIRKQVESWRQAEGVASLHAYLTEHDPVTASRLNVSDTQRVTRAVEVHQQTGKPISYWQAMPKHALAHNLKQNWLALSVMPDRAWLHERIERRLDIMWADGFLEEVFSLLNKYELSANMPSMRCVGYRQVIEYFIQIDLVKLEHNNLTIRQDSPIFDTKEELSVRINQSDSACQDMKNKALYATRQLAKRQYTWLKKIVSIEQINMNTDRDEKDKIFANHNTNLTVFCFDNIENVKQQLM